MSTERRGDDAGENEGPVIRDKRRIDPVTGNVRETADEPLAAREAGGGSAAAGGAAGAKAPGRGKHAKPVPEEAGHDDEVTRLTAQMLERTADVQRVQAEYANYRKRVERDRVAVREQALANVLTELVPVLDDIGRAREHDELTGGFKSVAESLESIVGKLGLERFGEKGEPFDPNVHEALMHSYSDKVKEPTCVDVLQPGYSVAGRVLRPARVAVAEPAEEQGTQGQGSQGQGAGQDSPAKPE